MSLSSLLAVSTLLTICGGNALAQGNTSTPVALMVPFESYSSAAICSGGQTAYFLDGYQGSAKRQIIRCIQADGYVSKQPLYSGPVDMLAASPSGKYVVFGENGDTGKILDTATGTPPILFPGTSKLKSIGFLGESAFAILGEDEYVRVFRTSDGSLVKKLAGTYASLGNSGDRNSCLLLSRKEGKPLSLVISKLTYVSDHLTSAAHPLVMPGVIAKISPGLIPLKVVSDRDGSHAIVTWRPNDRSEYVQIVWTDLAKGTCRNLTDNKDAIIVPSIARSEFIIKSYGTFSKREYLEVAAKTGLPNTQDGAWRILFSNLTPQEYSESPDGTAIFLPSRQILLSLNQGIDRALTAEYAFGWRRVGDGLFRDLHTLVAKRGNGTLDLGQRRVLDSQGGIIAAVRGDILCWLDAKSGDETKVLELPAPLKGQLVDQFSMSDGIGLVGPSGSAWGPPELDGQHVRSFSSFRIFDFNKQVEIGMIGPSKQRERYSSPVFSEDRKRVFYVTESDGFLRQFDLRTQKATSIAKVSDRTAPASIVTWKGHVAVATQFGEKVQIYAVPPESADVTFQASVKIDFDFDHFTLMKDDASGMVVATGKDAVFLIDQSTFEVKIISGSVLNVRDGVLELYLPGSGKVDPLALKLSMLKSAPK